MTPQKRSSRSGRGNHSTVLRRSRMHWAQARRIFLGSSATHPKTPLRRRGTQCAPNGLRWLADRTTRCVTGVPVGTLRLTLFSCVLFLSSCAVAHRPRANQGRACRSAHALTWEEA
eukprot:2397126-Prymnesium_polylepis.1